MPEINKNQCSHCGTKAQCWPQDLPHDVFRHIEGTVAQRRCLVRGEQVQRQGEPFQHVIVVCHGFLRTSVSTPQGTEQVTGVHMAGDFIGLDGVASGVVDCDAVALRDSEVRLFSFASLEHLARDSRSLQRHIYRLMGQEIGGRQQAQLALNHLRADGRVARVLVNLSQRLGARGYSPLELDLPLTRKDLGSLVHLTLESVCRALTRMAAAGILEVQRSHVHILDMGALTRMAMPANLPGFAGASSA